MRANLFLSLIFILLLVGCNNHSAKKENQVNNGIDSQILSVVDSIIMEINNENYWQDSEPIFNDPFISVIFGAIDDSNYVVRFINGLSIPISHTDFHEKIPISKNVDFKGYRKVYKRSEDVYLIFYEYNPNGKFERFVNKDSLLIDEKPFDLYDVYNENRHNKIIDTGREWIYLINKNDSLQFLRTNPV